MILKQRLIAVVMAAAAIFSSCSDDEVVGDGHFRKQTIIAEQIDPTEDQQSRTCVDMQNAGTDFVGLLWQVDDKLGVFTQSGTENALFSNTATENAPKTEFGGEINGTVQYAYFPYNSENNGRLVSELKGTLLAEQPFDLESGSLVCDYKIGKRSDEGSNKFCFEQLFTMLNITIDASETSLEGEKLNSILLKVTDAEGNGRSICGDFTFSAIDGTWTAGDNLSNSLLMPWTTQPALEKDKSYQGFVTVMPVVKKDDKLYIEVITENHKASFTADCNLDLLKGYIYNIPLKLKEFAANEKFSYVEQVIENPSITEFKFEVSKNSGKLLDNELKWNSSSHTPSFSSVTSYTAMVNNETNEITLTIPYLYDFKLKPTFTVDGSDYTVQVNGVEQQSAVTEVDFTAPVTYTVTNSEGRSRDYTVKITNSGLPVVVVEQSETGDFSDEKVGGTNIFGTVIGARVVNTFVDFKIRGKETVWVTDDQITIYNADGTIDCEVTGGVRHRGNTSRDYPKKPFAMKFNSKKSVLGMPAHKRWVLLANWLDHSMIRNTVAFDIAHAIENAWTANTTIEPGIPWNVHGQHVELVFIENGEAHHVGNYFLCEQIKIDGNRLDIKDSYEDVIETNSSPTLADCGYLLEFDSKEDKDPYFTTSNGIKVKYKDDAIDGTALATAVKNKVQGIEDNLDSGNYAAAYENLDLNTVIDQWLIWELTMNREYGDPGSVYMYMDGDGKLCAGPVWDFDRGTFQYYHGAAALGNTESYRLKPYDQWMCSRTEETFIWYKQLIKDSTFKETVKKRWGVIKPYLEQIVNQIRMHGQTQAISYEYDSVMWPTNKADIRKYKSDFNDWSGDEEITDYTKLIETFVNSYQSRLNGIDALISEF